MTELDHKSERKQCEKELVNMPGKWRVARKNDRFEFHLSIKPDAHFLVIQYRSVTPKGWVLFEAKLDTSGAKSPSSRPWLSRKKVGDVSYLSPGAAAVAAAVANLIPDGEARTRGQQRR